MRSFVGRCGKTGSDFLGCLGLVLCGAALVPFFGFDDQYLSPYRPWSLLLLLALFAAGVASLVCLVLVSWLLLKKSEERPLIVAGGLLAYLVGVAIALDSLAVTIHLGCLLALAYVLGWQFTKGGYWWRNGKRRFVSRDERQKMRSLMTVWSVALAVAGVVLLFVWWKTPAGRPLFPSEAPLRVTAEPLHESPDDRPVYRLGVENQSDHPLSINYFFYEQGWHGREEQAKYQPRQHLELPPHASADLPTLYPRGYSVEFDCGEAGIKVFFVD